MPRGCDALRLRFFFGCSGNHVLVDPDSVEDTTVQLGPIVKVRRVTVEMLQNGAACVRVRVRVC
jgi:hypothetical protein